MLLTQLFLAGVVMTYALPASMPVTSTAVPLENGDDDCYWSNLNVNLNACVGSVRLLDPNTQCGRAPVYFERRRYVYFCSETYTADTFNANFTVHSVNDDTYRLHIAHREGDCDYPYPAGQCGGMFYSSNWDGTLSRPNAKPYPFGKWHN